MRFVGKLFRRREGSNAEPLSTCAHPVLRARWDSPTDMGDQDKISAYACERCGASFSPDVGQRLIYEQQLQRYREEYNRPPARPGGLP